MHPPRRLSSLVRIAARLHARLSRALTLGVRGLVRDEAGRICLVAHTYMPGWHLPGGGVERGEAAHDAMARELAEEAGVILLGAAKLVSIHDNGRHFAGDHVLVYVAGSWRAATPTQSGEIARIGWFAPDALPPGTTPGTRARIGEILDGAPADPRW